jgi:hypothetical protein
LFGLFNLEVNMFLQHGDSLSTVHMASHPPKDTILPDE